MAQIVSGSLRSFAHKTDRDKWDIVYTNQTLNRYLSRLNN